MEIIVNIDERTALSNKHLSDMRLSLEAKGLFSIMLSELNMASCTIEELKAFTKDGEDIEQIIKELAKNQYIHLV